MPPNRSRPGDSTVPRSTGNTTDPELVDDSTFPRVPDDSTYPRLQDDDDPPLASTTLREELRTIAVRPEVPTDTSPLTGEKKDPLINAAINGFRVEAVLGRGAAGIVYRAQHLATKRKAAFKILKPEFADEPEYLLRMIEEAKALMAINHPGIIGILDFGQMPNGQPYLVMELCDGLSLEEELKLGGRPTTREAMEMVDDLLAALEAAHGKGIIHRDLKPSNLFIATLPDGSRRLKVLDFGLARSSARSSVRATIPGTMVGTPDFMAPEQIDGTALGPWTDVYAVGGIAFRLLSNRLPFVGDSAMAVLSLKMGGTTPHAREVDPKVPAELDALVAKLMSRKPAERPGVTEARARIAAWLNSVRRTMTGSPLNEEDDSVKPTSFHQFNDVRAAQGVIPTQKERTPEVIDTSVDMKVPHPTPQSRRTTVVETQADPIQVGQRPTTPERGSLEHPTVPPSAPRLARPTRPPEPPPAMTTVPDRVDALSSSRGRRMIFGAGISLLVLGALVALALWAFRPGH